jgi:actin-related protein
MEKIWYHKLCMSPHPKKHSALLSQAPLNLKNNIKKMTQIMSETFNSRDRHMTIQVDLSVSTSSIFPEPWVGVGDMI